MLTYVLSRSQTHTHTHRCSLATSVRQRVFGWASPVSHPIICFLKLNNWTVPMEYIIWPTITKSHWINFSPWLLCLSVTCFFFPPPLYQIGCITSMVFVQAQVMTAICCYLVSCKSPVPRNGSIIIVARHRLLLPCYESAISYCVQLYIRVTWEEDMYSLHMKRQDYWHLVERCAACIKAILGCNVKFLHIRNKVDIYTHYP